MLKPGFGDAIAAAQHELEIEIATTPSQVTEVKRLRYRVYCEERGFEPGSNGLEQDDFDGQSKHVLVRCKATGATLGTVRVVMPTIDQGHDGFPMNRACDSYVLGNLGVRTTGEISRFALTRDRTGISAPASALLRLCLMRGIVDISGQSNLTHWCAIMETSLLRLLRATAIHFDAIGPQVEYHGIRQPVVGAIGMVLSRIRREQPVAWKFLTNEGALWPNTNCKDGLVAGERRFIPHVVADREFDQRFANRSGTWQARMLLPYAPEEVNPISRTVRLNKIDREIRGFLQQAAI